MAIWSFNTDALNALPLEATFQFALDHGFRAIEVCGDRPQGFYEDVDADARARCRGLAEQGGLRVTYHSPLFGTNLGSSVAEVRTESMRWMRGAVDMAAELGAELFVVHPATIDYEDDSLRGPCFRDCVRNLRDLCDYAGERGIRVGLENIAFMSDSLDQCMEDLIELRGTIDHPNLSYVFDFGHALLTDGHPEIRKGIHLMGTDMVHIHLTDNRGKRDDHIEIGTGVIDYAPYAEFLRNFDHTVVLELMYHSSDGAEVLRSREAIERVVAEATSQA